ncbi:Ras-related protein Rab-18-B [Nymphon striatum]|nr:Ras-related protein Rab-18-B [Nymphon striatum]
MQSSPPTQSTAQVDTVSFTLPQYWTSYPDLWFAQIEIKFRDRGFRSQNSMYEQVVSQLPQEAAIQVRDIISRRPSEDPYDVLKAALIKRSAISQQQRIQRLLASEELGDRTPSQLLRHMQQLLGDAPTGNPSIFSEIFLGRLPTQVRAVLATFPETTSLDKLAEAADRIIDVTGHHVSTVNSVSYSSELQALRDEIAQLKVQLNQHSKFFTVDVKGRKDSIALDRLKPVFTENENSPSHDYNFRTVPKKTVLYDVTNRNSFSKLDMWLNELETYSTRSDIVKMLVGNKIDKDNRDLSREEGMKFARKHSMLFIEASAKTKDGVQCAFEELVEKIIQTPGLWDMDQSRNGKSIKVNEFGGQSQSWSCSGYCSLTERNTDSDKPLPSEARPEFKPNGELALQMVMMDKKENEENSGRFIMKKKSVMGDNFKWWMVENNSGLRQLDKLVDLIDELSYKQPSDFKENNKPWKQNPTRHALKSKHFRKMCTKNILKRSRRKRNIARLAKLGLLPNEPAKLMSKNSHVYYYFDC